MMNAAPSLDFRVYPDEEGDPNDVEFAMISPLGTHILNRYPNLKAVMCTWAGVDKLVGNPQLPEEIPVIRNISDDLTTGMTQYVVMHCLRYYRDHDAYARQSSDMHWQVVRQKEEYLNVGILGLGALGRDAAEKLSGLGFSVAGWSRRRKDIPGVACYAGREELARFLARTHTLVCLLPVTPETENIIDAQFLQHLPRGAYIINPARGEHIVEEDLIYAIDNGALAGATLDVFRQEPLPENHPFWAHPKILVTPHVASISFPTPSAANWYTNNMTKIAAGEMPLGGVVDLSVGY